MKIISIAALFIASLFIFNDSWAIAHNDHKNNIVVTIKPLHAMVSGVIGSTDQVVLLVDKASPHGFQLKPSQVRAVQQTDVIFYIDDRFETFLPQLFATLPTHIKKLAVAQKAGLTILPYRKGGAWDTHKHEAHEHETEHATAKGHYHDHHDHHDDDLHVWLDPENARKIVTFVTRELSKIYPENQDIYQANAQQYIEKIDALDAELKASLTSLQDQPFIVFHDAYQYFERAYGLNSVGSITFEPDVPPSPKHIKEVREKLQKMRVSCVFREPQFSDRLIATVTEGTNAQSGILDPLGIDLDAGETLYFGLMKNLATNLRQCLSSTLNEAK